MFDILLPWIAILIGFTGLIWSADKFVEGSASIASRFGISKLIIGLTVVAFGTSAPEVVVSISSSLRNAGDLAIGNAIGSNLANIGLVLGITALIAPLPIKTHILKQEFVIMLGVFCLAGFFLFDSRLSLLEGIILVSMMIPLLLWIAYSKKQHPEDGEELPEITSMKAGILWFIFGLSLLIASAEILVWGAKTVALEFGVSPLIIGLTVVAVGTSLPELAASVMSALKGHHDIAIGNVIGSNIFNLLLVMGIAPIINPISMEAEVFSRDFAAMSIIALFLGGAMLFSYLKSKGNSQLGRLTGIGLLILYLAYYTLLFK
jgi:cation:H+ antiporter